MKVSVIIPVFNAEQFIAEATESALAQPEVAEIILVEDGSLDNSFAVCCNLEDCYEKVRLFHHLNRSNLGASASRNLGIRNSKYEVVAFLDADDFYLPERFSATSRILDGDKSVDGVYEAVGYHFQQEETAESHPNSKNCLTTMTKWISPENLFEAQAPIGNYGYCCTPGWTVRKEAFKRSGFFDENIHMHEDTILFAKLAGTVRLMPGNLDEPVAMRRVHAGNRITAPRSDTQKFYDLLLMWQALASWAPGRVSRRRQFLLFRKWLYCYMDGPSPRISHPVWRKPFGVHRMLHFLLVRALSLPTKYPIHTCKPSDGAA